MNNYALPASQWFTSPDNSFVDHNLTIMPSRTYKLSYTDNNLQISGMCDGIDSIKQSIKLILACERYKFLIFSHYYGVEIENLFGESKGYVIPELKRRLTEALMRDDRVKLVSEFEFEKIGSYINISFNITVIHEIVIRETLNYNLPIN